MFEQNGDAIMFDNCIYEEHSDVALMYRNLARNVAVALAKRTANDQQIPNISISDD